MEHAPFVLLGPTRVNFAQPGGASGREVYGSAGPGAAIRSTRAQSATETAWIMAGIRFYQGLGVRAYSEQTGSPTR